MQIEAGKLIHTARLYKSLYVKNNDGTGKNQLEYVKKVRCSIRDVSYQNKDNNNKTTEDATLKITTHYFDTSSVQTYDHNINMLVQIDSSEQLYKITYIENVLYENKVLIFSLSKDEGSYD